MYVSYMKHTFIKIYCSTRLELRHLASLLEGTCNAQLQGKGGSPGLKKMSYIVRNV